MVAPLAALALVLTAVTGGEEVNTQANSGQFPIYRITVNDPVEGPIALITFVPADKMDVVGGLPSQTIVGRQIRIAEGLDPDNFTQNRAFVDFLHALVREVVPTVKEFEEFVRTVPDGWFNVQDGRATLKGLPLPSEDLIGRYRVLRGRFAVGEYEPNRGYSVMTENGMMTPHPEIRTRLLAVMRALPFNEAAMASSVGARGDGTEAPEPPSLSPIAAERFNQLYHRAHQLMKGQLVLDGAPNLPPLGWSGRHRLKKAIQLLQKAIDLNPSSWQSMFHVGKIHQRLADADVALDWFLRAHELSPTNRSVAKEAGAAAIHTGQTDLAVRVLEHAVVHNPGDPALWYNLGTAYLLSTRPSRARVAYEAAAALEPAYPTTARLVTLAIEVENGSRDCPRTESEMKSAI